MKLIRSALSIIRLFMRFILGVLTAAVIFWWLHSIDMVAENAPDFSSLNELNYTIPPDEEVFFGRAELLQPGGTRTAELKHVRLRASQDGQLFISRAAEIRNLNVEFGGLTEEGSSEQYEILRQQGAITRISAGSQFFDISVQQDGGIAVKVEDGPGTHTTAIIYDNGNRTVLNGEPAQGCYEQSAIAKFTQQAAVFTQKSAISLSKFLADNDLGFLFSRRGKSTIAILGGDVNCSLYRYPLIAMPRANQELEFSIRQNLSNDRLFISIYRKAQFVPISYETWLDGTKIREHYGRTGVEVPVASATPLSEPIVTHFTAGRTRYTIAANDLENGHWNVQIKPSKRIALFDDSVCSRPLSSAADTLLPEDCPPPLESSPNTVPEGVDINVVKQDHPPGLERLFVATPDGLSSAEILARASAIGLSLLIILAVPGATAWRANGSIFRAIFLWVAAIGLLALCLLPDLMAIARIFIDIQNSAQIMFYAMGALWICATIVIMFDRSGGTLLAAFWLVLTGIIAISSISMFSLSLEGSNTDWERFFVKHKLVVLDILPLFVIALTIVSPTALKLRIGNDFAGRPSIFSPIFWLLAIVLALFVAWFFIGNQTGLGGSIQPVEAGKFAVIVLLGAALAQWLIRARLLAQAWFGLTVIAIVLSALFIVALLFVPAVKSDYSPLIIITSAAIITGIIGFRAIGSRIREEEMTDIKDINKIPLPYTPEIRDVRLKPTQFLFLLVILTIIIFAPLILVNERFLELLQFINSKVEYQVGATALLALSALYLVRLLFVHRAAIILLMGLPLALIGTWAVARDEMIILLIVLSFAALVSLAIALAGRINWSLARLAIAIPIIALIFAIGLRDLPTKMGLGVEEWSWFERPEQQIEELEKVLGKGRRLPVERLMSWADLRFDRFDGNLETQPETAPETAPETGPETGQQTRQLALRDLNFHVLRSRATLANAPCGLSPELTSAPHNVGVAAQWFGHKVSQAMGLPCTDEYILQIERPGCTPATLKGPVRPHCVPVVQSDFAATYITARFGISAAAILVALQVIFIVLVGDVYLRLQSRRSRDPVETGADQALACIALGSGMLFLMQWILAWSNAFGILPVMGQPMTWLSAGTSHHLFMAIPAALVLLVAARLAGMETPVLTIRVPPRRRG